MELGNTREVMYVQNIYNQILKKRNANAKYRATLIPGDGIGPEVVGSTIQAIEATGVYFDWDIKNAGTSVIPVYNTPLPDDLIASIQKTKLALKGPVTTPKEEGFRSVNVGLRQEFDLYSNLRPAKLFDGVKSRYGLVDLVVVRENTEDLYIGVEFAAGSQEANDLISKTKKIKEGSSISLKSLSYPACERIVRFAFDYAKENDRRKVTVVTKSNIVKNEKMFLDAFKNVSEDYKDIKKGSALIDALCMDLVMDPGKYDVLVLPNLYGDIVSDLCAGLVGGLGYAPSLNIGKDTIIAEAVHGSFPEGAGRNIANPIGMMLSGSLMLGRMGEKKAAKCLEDAVIEVLREENLVNEEGFTDTLKITDVIISKINKFNR
nr:3-isopropylmalate/3-methylmalate dehydrogenase [uncultured archaeon]